MTFWFDFETRCKVGIHEGLDLYLRACEPIIMTWARDNSDVAITEDTRQMALILQEAAHRGEPMVAHNATFDAGIAELYFGVRLAAGGLRCTRAQAYAHGLPGSLDLLGKVLGVPVGERKLAGGKDLIALFCIPRPDGAFNDATTHPVEWQAFCDYAVRDTAALREVYKRLPRHNYQGDALKWYALDQLVNWRGFRFDKPLAVAARHLLELAKEKSDGRVSEATQGEVRAATQRNRLLVYLNRSFGADLPNLRAATVRDMLECDDLQPGLRYLLEARLEAAKSSGAKYGRGLALCGPQERLRHTHQCFGAGRTGRDSGKGFQPQNLPRQSVKSNDVEREIELLKMLGPEAYATLT